MTFCANNPSHPGPFSTDPDGFAFCRACATEMAVEKRGPERGYEPTGGLPTLRESIAAGQNDPAYQHASALDNAHARYLAPRRPTDDYDGHRADAVREARSRRHVKRGDR